MKSSTSLRLAARDSSIRVSSTRSTAPGVRCSSSRASSSVSVRSSGTRAPSTTTGFSEGDGLPGGWLRESRTSHEDQHDHDQDEHRASP